MEAKQILDAGDRWTDVSTRIAMPIVMRYAMSGMPIEYGQLNTAVAANGGTKVMDINYKTVAGKIGDICEALGRAGKQVPLLNSIIIGKHSHLPNDGIDGYLQRYFGIDSSRKLDLDNSQRDAYAREAMQVVFDFVGWAEVARVLGISRRLIAKPIFPKGKAIKPPDRSKFATGLESEEHKRLKRLVAGHPEIFSKFGKFSAGLNEAPLHSGDRLDVLFQNRRGKLAAEVKTKNAPLAELERGVYQCVKYQATLRAMQLAEAKPPNAKAVLVIDQKSSSSLNYLARRLSIQIITIYHIKAMFR